MAINKKPLYATNLNYLRMQRKLTCNDIFKLTGIKVQTWRSYEEGRAFPQGEKLPAICRVLEHSDILAWLTKDLTMEDKSVSKQQAIEALKNIKVFLESIK